MTPSIREAARQTESAMIEALKRFQDEITAITDPEGRAVSLASVNMAWMLCRTIDQCIDVLRYRDQEVRDADIDGAVDEIGQ
jgi:hypothetical protein